jgi:hypothetical protein
LALVSHDAPFDSLDEKWGDGREIIVIQHIDGPPPIFNIQQPNTNEANLGFQMIATLNDAFQACGATMDDSHQQGANVNNHDHAFSSSDDMEFEVEVINDLENEVVLDLTINDPQFLKLVT